MNFTEPVILRPRKWPAAIPLVLALVFFIFISPQKNDYTVPIVCVVLLLVSIFMFLILLKAQIILDDTGMTYKTLFGTKEISWQAVAKTYLRFRHHGQSGSYYWYFETPGAKKIKFSMRLYSRKSLHTIAKAVTTKCREAQIDDRIHNMAEGVFPWYIF